MTKKTGEKKVLNISDFLAARNTKLVEETIDELGGVVYLKPLVAGDMVDYMHTQRRDATPEEKANGTLQMLTKCICGEDGSGLFDGAPIEDLRSLPAPIFTKLISLSNKVNGVEPGDQGKG